MSFTCGQDYHDSDQLNWGYGYVHFAICYWQSRLCLYKCVTLSPKFRIHHWKQHKAFEEIVNALNGNDKHNDLINRGLCACSWNISYHPDPCVLLCVSIYSRTGLYTSRVCAKHKRWPDAISSLQPHDQGKLDQSISNVFMLRAWQKDRSCHKIASGYTRPNFSRCSWIVARCFDRSWRACVVFVKLGQCSWPLDTRISHITN